MLSLAFLLSLSAFIFQGISLSSLHFYPFLPYLALCLLRLPFASMLWCFAAVGAIHDLFSDDPMGVHAIAHVLNGYLFNHIRKHFSHDTPLHISLLTALMSAGFTMLHLGLLFLFDRRVPFQGRWILADTLAMPLMDALYAFVWFSAPLSLFQYIRKLWTVFWLKRKSPSPESP